MRNRFCKICLFFLTVLMVWSIVSCGGPQSPVRVEGKRIAIEFNQKLYSRVAAIYNGKTIVLGDYAPSEFVTVSGNDITDFALKERSEAPVKDRIGAGKRWTLTGESNLLRKIVSITVYQDFPGMAVFRVVYTNIGDSNVRIDRWINNHYQIKTAKETPEFWSFQSGSYESRPDWVLPIKPGFEQENYMGMNATDYGGGTPVSDVWRRDAGLAVGHLEKTPKLVSLPVRVDSLSGMAEVSVKFVKNQILSPGDTLATFTTFAAVHQGDYFQILSRFRSFMQKQGLSAPLFPQTAYEPIWCAWGYERNFNVKEILNTLPKVKELGYEWAVLDDGWQTAEGDWYLVKSKFPRGDRDMKNFVDKIHAAGLKAKLWWAPLAVDPGTDLIKNHPEYVLLNQDGSKQDISWWDAYYLCPAYPGVQQYTKKLVEKFLKTWGFDGLKIDGQHLNAAPPCYNPAHHHDYPEESYEKLPEFFEVIYETATRINPNAVVEICPCGTACSFYNMNFMNQPVASDPTSSWQIRLKGKTYKALMGPSVPYYGDHVELSDGKDDFASTVGVGGVIGTKFTWPVGVYLNNESGDVSLTPEKETKWKKWMNIYRDKMLPRGEYLGGLYDIGFDRPEAHAITKDGNMYYAFYADSYRGKVELRGLKNLPYRVVDYVNQKDLGTVQGPTAKLEVQFKKHLLLGVTPK